MFVHLGGEKVIRMSELIAILDLSTEQSVAVHSEYIAQAERRNAVEKIGEEAPKSLVVTDDRLYYSPISSTTLKKRVQAMNERMFLL